MIQLGFAFLHVDKSGFEHLRFVISSPQVDPENVVTVNISTFEVRKDKSCIIEPEDHAFIRHRSCVMYDEADTWALADIESLLARHVIQAHDPASDKLIDKLLDGAYATKRMPLKMKKILAEQKII
jgi:hypothetical protein